MDINILIDFRNNKGVNNLMVFPGKIKNIDELKNIIFLAMEDMKKEVRYRTQIEYAISMKKRNYSIKEISEITGLKEKVIRDL